MQYSRLTLSAYRDGILRNDRIILSKAITLVESTLPHDREMAAKLIDAILPRTGNSIRIGITGVPGVGKSTFIEAFGRTVTDLNKKIAVLTIDPSSQFSRGSILGDKTRMETLSKNKQAFIRPSSTGDVLGGVAHRTREAILLCEAAGFEVIVVETVGVGQSEIAVKDMVDFFLLLMLAGAGDELQGIKKGIMEMADAVVITKADGDNVKHATEAQAEYQQSLHFHLEKKSGWVPKVMTCSAFDNRGIEEVWATIAKFKDQMSASGFLAQNREQQNIAWFQAQFYDLLKQDFSASGKLLDSKTLLESEIIGKQRSPNSAALELLHLYHQDIKNRK